jgi:hypothetical protein
VPDRLGLEPGSPTDSAITGCYANGLVPRGLSSQAVDDWEALASTKLFARLVDPAVQHG